MKQSDLRVYIVIKLLNMVEVLWHPFGFFFSFKLIKTETTYHRKKYDVLSRVRCSGRQYGSVQRTGIHGIASSARKFECTHSLTYSRYRGKLQQSRHLGTMTPVKHIEQQIFHFYRILLGF